MTVELVGSAERTIHSHRFAALYAQVQRFYADQMQILDAPDTGRWAATFTEDAVLELPALPGPVSVRAGLAGYVHASTERRRRTDGTLRHWVGMLDVRPQEDGSLHTRCSALVHAMPSGGGAKVLYVCVMEDVLVPSRGEWRAARRRVTRDDLA